MQGRWWNAAVVSIAVVLVVSGAVAAGAPPALGYTTYLPVVLKSVGAACSVRPTLINPANGSTLDTLVPLYVWNDGGDPAGTSARLQIAHDAAFTHGAGSLRSSMRGEHEFRFSTNLDPGSTYYWRAWVMCGDVQGPYSEVWSFTTGSGGTIPPAPALTAPANSSTLPSTTVTLQWASVPGTVEYLVRWRRPDQSGYNYEWTSEPQLVTWLEPHTTYEWWVSARNDYAIGTDSPVWQFTTGPGD